MGDVAQLTLPSHFCEHTSNKIVRGSRKNGFAPNPERNKVNERGNAGIPHSSWGTSPLLDSHGHKGAPVPDVGSAEQPYANANQTDGKPVL